MLRPGCTAFSPAHLLLCAVWNRSCAIQGKCGSHPGLFLSCPPPVVTDPGDRVPGHPIADLLPPGWQLLSPPSSLPASPALEQVTLSAQQGWLFQVAEPIVSFLCLKSLSGLVHLLWHLLDQAFPLRFYSNSLLPHTQQMHQTPQAQPCANARLLCAFVSTPVLGVSAMCHLASGETLQGFRRLQRPYCPAPAQTLLCGPSCGL